MRETMRTLFGLCVIVFLFKWWALLIVPVGVVLAAYVEHFESLRRGSNPEPCD